MSIKVHREQIDLAKEHIDKARKILITILLEDLPYTWTESYISKIERYAAELRRFKEDL